MKQAASKRGNLGMSLELRVCLDLGKLKTMEKIKK